MLVEQIKEELSQYIEPEKAEFLPRFFQSSTNGYGAGDQFLGVRVPNQRKIAKKYYSQISLDELQTLLQSPVHEYRLTAIIMLVHKYEKSKCEEERQQYVAFYLEHLDYVNNWDLVDISADIILGHYLYQKDRQLLYDLAYSNDLWRQRIAIMSTFYFIKKRDFTDTLKIAEILLRHTHHLIHKAVGWMLREVGKRDLQAELEFLRQHYHEMPRTMLRYAIEKFEPDLRQRFLLGEEC